MKINNLSYLFVVGALALASCSHDEYHGPDYVGGKLTVIATINQVNTRANNADWEPGDAIGVSSNGGHDNVHFSTADGDGVFQSQTPTYVLGAGETNFTAYYPHHSEVTADTPELSFTEPLDYMHASASATRENPVVNFIFNHKMSKISFKILDQAVNSGNGSIKLDGVVVDGKFHTHTGDVTAGTTKTSTSKNFNVNSVTDFILPPLAEGTGQVTVTLNYQGKVYGGFISVSTLKAGNEYQYTIDLTDADPALELNISSATITDWTTNPGGNIDMEEKDPSDVERGENTVLEVGDFLLSDGTTIDKNDEAIAKYKDQVVAVVYYAGNPQPSSLYSYSESQDILKKDAPKAVNGLAIAINNASEDPARFATTKYNFSTWYQSDSKDAATANPNYIGTNLSLTKPAERILGYNNTKVIEAATAELGAETTGTEYVLSLLDSYNTNLAMANASKWFIPSLPEFAAIINNYNVIEASVKKAGGELTAFPDYSKATPSELFYWTSDMRGSDNEWVSPLVTTEEDLFVGKNSNGTKGYFRFAIAF